MILEGVILSCIHGLQGERSISATYHVISGRKSIQTVQDIHMYDLKQFYSIYPKLSKSYFHKVSNALKKDQLIQAANSNEESYLITPDGMKWLDDYKTEFPLSYFFGLQYGYSSIVFWERLKLLIQTVTNVHMNQFQFIPVVENQAIEKWVKKAYQRIKMDTSAFLIQLHTELQRLLQTFPALMAEIFVDRLTSYDNYGKSIHQLANSYFLTMIDVELTITACLHRMIDIINQNKHAYPVLNGIIPEAETPHVTASALTTYYLLRDGLTVEAIADYRKLRMNTIYDHLVEIALYDSQFPIDAYVPRSDQKIIIRAFNEVNTYKLKLIKEKVPEHISYFHIRLVLTMLTNTQKVGG
ncbi:helix-turn-helix domain-containing protein [Virgibacillus pantothenticus]|uniref:helix-turn-helix domain-containing protein n=1 Tax=Virgibacillus pantothenticus TaxID=1473 RepID=UPI0025AFAEC4|nr:helix-turn-helix domain-containing protein [Virgibacillus pantothenticus]